MDSHIFHACQQQYKSYSSVGRPDFAVVLLHTSRTQDFTLPTKTHNERIILFSECHNFNIVIIATTVINSWFTAQLKWVPLFQHSNGVNGLSL